MFVLDEARVLRHYRDGRSAEREADLIRRLVEVGFPTARVLDAAGPDLTLERLDGPDLMTATCSGALATQEAGALLADLHRHLHALPWDGGALLHLDLHPLNVHLTAAGPMVLDWTNAQVGAPALDVAVTAMILAQAAVAPDAFADVGIDVDLLGGASGSLLAAFTAAAEPFADHLDQAAARRRGDENAGRRELETLDDAHALARSYAG